MAKAKHSLCKSKRNDNINNNNNNNNDKKTKTKTKKKKQFELFSESEIDVAEQLIQLSGDSSDDKNINSHEEISDGDTTHLMNRIKDNFFDEGDDGFDPRRKKRFKSLSEIYSLTNKPLF